MKNRISRAQIDYTRSTGNPHLTHSAEQVADEIDRVLRISLKKPVQRDFSFPKRSPEMSDNDYFGSLIEAKLFDEAIIFCYAVIGEYIDKNITPDGISYQVNDHPHIVEWENKVSVLRDFLGKK